MPSPSARLAGGGRRQTERSYYLTMTGAMYAAIAGLRTHMQNLNVIGNNVANVNTYGYKSARSVFETAIYTSLNGGSDGTAVRGGANPSQIGYGANMGSVGIDMSTGNYAVTGRNCDLMLDGDGFFIMGTKDLVFTGTGTDQAVLDGMNLTRTGNFDFGADGYLARDASDGLCVYGFQCVGTDPTTGEAIFSDQLVPLRIPGVKKTTVDGNTTIEIAYPIPGEVNATTGEVTYKAGGPLMDQTQQIPGGTQGQHEACPPTTLEAITFDSVTGVITGKSKDTGELITIGAIAVGNVQNPNGVTNLGGNYYQAGKGSGGLTVSTLGGLAESAKWGTVAPGANGAAATVTYSPTGGYMNQSLRGDNPPTDASTVTDVCRLRDGGETRLLSNGLEMSKTDLAQEISQMILTQRGYQANTRIITVTDSMLEELVNMKR